MSVEQWQIALLQTKAIVAHGYQVNWLGNLLSEPLERI